MLNKLVWQEKGDQKRVEEAGKVLHKLQATLCAPPLCCTSQGSPVEHLTEQNYELQGLTKIFLKGYKDQCF